MRDRAIPLHKLGSRRLSGAVATQAHAFAQQLEIGERQPAAMLAAYQLHHLKRLVAFATKEVEAYAGAGFAAAVARATSLPEALAAIPLTARNALATAPESFRSRSLPAGHQAAGPKRSSGTSGQVVTVETTNISAGWQSALNLRAQLWAGRDLARGYATIRKHRQGVASYPEGVVQPRWGDEATLPFLTGPASHLNTDASLEEQWEWLSRVRPDYLMTYPSIIGGLAARAEREGQPPCRLLGVSTVGETVDPDLRDACRTGLGAELFDTYSAEELGVIALQCPNSRRYHSMDDAMIVEILDDSDRPVRVGEMGRVVVTPLFNYATPLLRYDIGDLAERGAACSCGRALGVINRIVGRIRNIFRTRDGRTFWPSFGAKLFSRHIRVIQHQFRQLSFDELEVLLVTQEPVPPETEELVRQTMLRRMPEPLHIRFRYADAIPREPGGKYQEFVCLID
jgi:phenylacetate-CoA ligase